MLDNIFKKEKVKSTLLTIVGLVLVVIVTIWINSSKVSANVWPVVVSVSHVDIDFGTVFPGETLERNFTVTYATTGDGVYYSIIQKRKLLPPGHPEYPDGGDPEMLGYYRDLCPFLDKVRVEQEGDEFEDTEGRAFVGPKDTSDTWIVYFEVPAIFGHVSQDHIGEVVSSNGEYGCDVSIEIIEQ